MTLRAALLARVAELVRAGELPAKPDLVAEVSIGGAGNRVLRVRGRRGPGRLPVLGRPALRPARELRGRVGPYQERVLSAEPRWTIADAAGPPSPVRLRYELNVLVNNVDETVTTARPLVTTYIRVVDQNGHQLPTGAEASLLTSDFRRYAVSTSSSRSVMGDNGHLIACTAVPPLDRSPCPHRPQPGSDRCW
jgi:hypothetical protein